VPTAETAAGTSGLGTTMTDWQPKLHTAYVTEP
jgi:hypothetical protein